jgi:hypothetical protein
VFPRVWGVSPSKKLQEGGVSPSTKLHETSLNQDLTSSSPQLESRRA